MSFRFVFPVLSRLFTEVQKAPVLIMRLNFIMSL